MKLSLAVEDRFGRMCDTAHLGVGLLVKLNLAVEDSFGHTQYVRHGAFGRSLDMCRIDVCWNVTFLAEVEPADPHGRPRREP